MQSRTLITALESATHRLSYTLKALALCFFLRVSTATSFSPSAHSSDRAPLYIYEMCDGESCGHSSLLLANKCTRYYSIQHEHHRQRLVSGLRFSLAASFCYGRPPPLPEESREERKATPRAADCPGTRKCIFEPLRKYQSLSAPHAFVGGCERRFDRVRVLNY